MSYSCAEACWSLSRHALIFRRRQTQHNPSAEFGEQAEPQTTHFVVRFSVSASSEPVACSRMRLSITGSDGGGFRFIYQLRYHACQWNCSGEGYSRAIRRGSGAMPPANPDDRARYQAEQKTGLRRRTGH